MDINNFRISRASVWTSRDIHYQLFIINLRVAHDSLYCKRLSLNLVVLLYLQVRELCAQICCELACVEFTYNYSLVLREHFMRVLRQRAYIIELRQIAA